MAVLTQLVVLLAFIEILSIPSQAHAGFLSVLGSIGSVFGPTDKALSASVSNTAGTDGSTLNSQNIPLLKDDLNPNPQFGIGDGEVAIIGDDALVPESGPTGAAADISNDEQSNQISTYIVQSGDTLSQIAQMFDVSVNTIVWANDLKSQSLQPGETLVILPITGVQHTVQKGDTMESIAKKYGADVNEIMQFNNISSNDQLVIGQTLTIPDGELSTPAGEYYSPSSKGSSSSGKYYTSGGHTFFLANDGSSEPVRGTGGPDYVGYYMKPVNGVLTQGLHGYNAVDLGAPIGTPIWAAAAGTVIVSKMGGWNGGYGNYVVISHQNGTQTLYAHMKETVVSVNESVAQGQTIGYVGVTGMTTGPHLHFEVRGAYNPFQ